jgi:uncharacterized protein (DUF1330 family)
MTAYAIGHLSDVTLNQGIVDYLRGIDATLAPFEGRFIIHGGSKEDLEGRFSGDLIVISFPDLQTARDWYNSPAYQALVPLRQQGADGRIFLIDGVDGDHRATDVLRGSIDRLDKNDNC